MIFTIFVVIFEYKWYNIYFTTFCKYGNNFTTNSNYTIITINTINTINTIIPINI